MQLGPDDLAYLAKCAITAAHDAGALIKSYASRPVEVRHKDAGDSVAAQVVTEVDLRSEAAIIEVLLATVERYDLALLTEETDDNKSRLDKDYFWCVDPMDGTLSFIESIPGYAVSIALVSQSGEPLIGVIYDPVTRTLYCAVKGRGVLRNGEPWLPYFSSAQGKSLTLVCDRGFTQQGYYPDVCDGMESIAIKHGFSGLQTLEKNGAVLNACFVLENPPACYFKCPKPGQGGGSLWDFAATAAVFNELGYVASDFYGQPLDLNRADTTFMNHRGVLYCMDPALASDIQGLLVLCSNSKKGGPQ